MNIFERRTKIIATLGPATESPEMLGKLIAEGTNIFRLNMAHATHDWVLSICKRIREASAKEGQEVAIMMDIKGPEIRTGAVDAPIHLQPGEIFDFTVRPGSGGGFTGDEEVSSVDVNYRDLVNDIKVGDTVLVDNGVIRLEVLEKNDSRIRCRVLTEGQLGSRRHINLPGIKVNLPPLTEKDQKDVLVGIEAGIDYYAQSFVREGDDIDLLRDFLSKNGDKAPIIAKIEDQQAIRNLRDIIRRCDGLMVARGDLGIECPYEELPIIQRRAVKTCLKYGKPVIIATHMLESMIDSPMPTRAEVTDVANAVYEQADCVMLSGETTVGKYPVDCVKVLKNIARRIERSGGANFAEDRPLEGDKDRLLRSAAVMADGLGGAGLVVFTRYGYLARILAAMRPRHAPIFAFTNQEKTLRDLILPWGIHPYLLNYSDDPEKMVAEAITLLKKEGQVKAGDKLVMVANVLAGEKRIETVQMRYVE
ncbi:MAG: pyruvate kinase [Opitutales bacterium]|nr:pyruvate kinase [Opitutales bacterium]MCH8541119.1 pyruvate kinase [Opitutales bacterium]